MATIAAVAQLGPAYEGAAIGYRVLDLAREEVTAFTTTGVVESAVPGTFAVAADVGDEIEGFIVWGLLAEDLAEATFSLPDLSGVDLSPVEDAITAALAGAIIYARGSAPDVTGADFSVRRGDDVTLVIATTIAPDADFDALIFTMKRDRTRDEDQDAVLQVRLNRAGGAFNGEDDGLLVVAGHVPGEDNDAAAGDGEITDVDVAEQLITIQLGRAATRLLDPAGALFWDIQQTKDGADTTLESGRRGSVTADTTWTAP